MPYDNDPESNKEVSKGTTSTDADRGNILKEGKDLGDARGVDEDAGRFFQDLSKAQMKKVLDAAINDYSFDYFTGLVIGRFFKILSQEQKYEAEKLVMNDHAFARELGEGIGEIVQEPEQGGKGLRLGSGDE